ncbi:MAG TPA: hypothetical protein VLF61_03625 [Rhabdochlamydiaceae bacterium]|nr:hypothetical protein [Rhabdochlamydiaceae bacterium]
MSSIEAFWNNRIFVGSIFPTKFENFVIRPAECADNVIAKVIIVFFSKLFNLLTLYTFYNHYHQVESERQSERNKLKNLKAKTEELRDKIQRVDDFISSHQDLYKLCQQRIKRDKDFIATHKLPAEYYSLRDDDFIEANGKLTIEINYLEFELNERRRFIERYDGIKELFQECLKKDKMTRILPNTPVGD